MAKPGLGGRHQAIAKVLRKQVEKGAPCHICEAPIDLTLPPRTRWSFSVDHLDPRSKGGQSTLANSAPAHYGCNSRRGNGTAKSKTKTWKPRRW